MTQPGPDGKPRLVAYYSKKLIDAELNYEIHDKELLAIIRALQHWRVYLEGAKYLTSKMVRNIWKLLLHNRILQRKENERADALSRRPDHEEGIKTPEPALLRTNRKGDLEYNP
uniref:Transposon Tf2-8 polyprotein n=1 Tax=Talaromyces marneffei PM1 TaxID=1077442 RepID=A0A093ULA6_TALMA